MSFERMTVLPDEGSYGYGSDNSIVSNRLDGGASRSRRDQINSASVINCTWTVNPADYQYLRAFFNYYTNRGVKPFLIELILDQPYLEVYQAKFIANTFETPELAGNAYIVSADLEVVPNHDPEFDEMVLHIYELGGMDYLNILEQLANYDLEI